MKFTPEQALMVTLLAEIHQALRIKEGINSDLISHAIWSGNTWAIDWDAQYPGSDEEHQPDPPYVTHVVDVLDMYDLLSQSYQALNDTNKKKYDTAVKFGAPDFPGFDGNNESEYLSAMRMLVDHLGRFQSYKGRILNSHHPTVERSINMLRVFLPIRNKLRGRNPMVLTVDELIEVMSV